MRARKARKILKAPMARKNMEVRKIMKARTKQRHAGT